MRTVRTEGKVAGESLGQRNQDGEGEEHRDGLWCGVALAVGAVVRLRDLVAGMANRLFDMENVPGRGLRV